MSSEQNKVILKSRTYFKNIYGEKKGLEDISIYLEQGNWFPFWSQQFPEKTTLFNVLSVLSHDEEGLSRNPQGCDFHSWKHQLHAAEGSSPS